MQIGFKTQPWIDKHNCRGSWTYVTKPITTTQLEVERSHKGRADHCVGYVTRTKGHPKWSDLRWQEGGDYAADTEVMICLTLLCRWQQWFFFLNKMGISVLRIMHMAEKLRTVVRAIFSQWFCQTVMTSDQNCRYFQPRLTGLKENKELRAISFSLSAVQALRSLKLEHNH